MSALALVLLAALKIESGVVNSGGHPLQGTAIASANYRVSLDAIGDIARTGPSSVSFRVDAGFVSAYPPPGEVRGLRFTTKSHLIWDGERSTGTYDVYRGTLSTHPGTMATCFAPGLLSPATDDFALPSAGTGRFYLATATNRLREDGTLGAKSSGVERTTLVPCP